MMDERNPSSSCAVTTAYNAFVLERTSAVHCSKPCHAIAPCSLFSADDERGIRCNKSPCCNCWLSDDDDDVVMDQNAKCLSVQMQATNNGPMTTTRSNNLPNRPKLPQRSKRQQYACVGFIINSQTSRLQTHRKEKARISGLRQDGRRFMPPADAFSLDRTHNQRGFGRSKRRHCGNKLWRKKNRNHTRKLSSILSSTYSQLTSHNNYSAVYACDETAVWLDPSDGTCITEKGAKTVTANSKHHQPLQKSAALVLVWARVDGQRTYDGIFGENFRQNIFRGFETTDLGQLPVSLSVDTKDTLRRLEIHSAVVPGGTTKFIQAPDVCWNAPFKNAIREKYNDWMVNGEKPTTIDWEPEGTADGHLFGMDSVGLGVNSQTTDRKTLSSLVASRRKLTGNMMKLSTFFKKEGAIPNGLALLKQRRKEDAVIKGVEEIDLGEDESDASVDI
ncbi:hypothetical protein niasHT_018835 [Heterodera trifolii]|uniref:DDE-1 domain-containing protein n=1 Tax=Heterodera trifolii TaxID=157864 RepID=A0ABD2L345_9BILA